MKTLNKILLATYITLSSTVAFAQSNNFNGFLEYVKNNGDLQFEKGQKAKVITVPNFEFEGESYSVAEFLVYESGRNEGVTVSFSKETDSNLEILSLTDYKNKDGFKGPDGVLDEVVNVKIGIYETLKLMMKGESALQDYLKENMRVPTSKESKLYDRLLNYFNSKN